MALFNPHNAKRLGAIGGDAKFFTSHHKRTNHCIAIAGWNGDFKCKLAGKGNAEKPRFHTAANTDLATSHKGKGFVRDIFTRINQLFQKTAGIGASNRILGILFGDRNQLNIKLRP